MDVEVGAQLQRGNVVLLEAGEDAIGKAVEVIDGCAYSHAGLVDVDSDGYWLVSATWPTGNGVTRLDLVDVNVKRKLAVLPIPGGAAALDEATRWLEPVCAGPDGPSNFGIEQLVLASLAAAARHLVPGSPEREALWDRAHRLSRYVFRKGGHTPPCGARGGGPKPSEGVQPRWDCAAFVDHAFCNSGGRLVVDEESDPSPRDFKGVILAYLGLLRLLRPKFGIDAALDADALTEGALADLAVAETTSWLNADDAAIEPLVAQRPLDRWPPFLSLRHLHDAYPPVRIIERGDLTRP